MVAVVVIDTALVLMANIAPVLPPATGTVLGTEAALLLLDRATTIPPAGAEPFRITHPDAEEPPTREVGVSNTLARSGCGTSVFVSVEVPNVAEMYNGESWTTTFVLMGNEVVVWPAATVAVGGTVAAVVILLLSATVTPPDGAGLANVIVPVDDLPPTR